MIFIETNKMHCYKQLLLTKYLCSFIFDFCMSHFAVTLCSPVSTIHTYSMSIMCVSQFSPKVVSFFLSDNDVFRNFVNFDRAQFSLVCEFLKK